ncbi:alpha/beta hydrolase [Gilvimarinus algae]|uniref:Alpha/beta hydrolase n=1 Tax=Gilvimarinus algae TaxID=3058037 RepID=A0ABT8TLZ1_9GAMM|nr:alpha/beta hydrolase [Gilvimarinus sp. SDUM040014]MDO3383651.1 alpha/beta hydrolase [Gilvimarinus sp. SDUM040014]
MFQTLYQAILRRIPALALMLALPLAAFAHPGHYTVTKHDNVPWVVADGKNLTLDIYSPKTDDTKRPVVVIYHGGGWLINNESVMDAMSQYLAEEGGYVVANMNYRLLPDNDNTTTMNEIVEDVFGGLLWVKAHIAEYGGDPSRIAVTGDSAGGHLTSMILTRGRALESDGFGGESLGFTPSWLPEGKTAEQVAAEDGLAVQAAVVSYGAFDMLAAARGGFESPQNMFWQFAQTDARGIFGSDINPQDHPLYYQAVSPVYHIPQNSEYPLPPQLHHVGSEDTTTPPEAVAAYVDKLKAAGQPATLKIYEGKNHAYMDTGCLEVFGSCFDTHAVPVLEKDILPFLEANL